MTDRRSQLPRLAFFVSPIAWVLAGCGGEGVTGPKAKDPPVVDRHAAIPADAVKGTPATDLHPPILHSAEYEEPVPMPVINTAGGEDAPFIPAGRSEMYFFFGAVLEEDPSIAIRDPVNGIWVSTRMGGIWQEPTLVWLQDYDELALNGCPVVDGNEMYFCTARAGYTGLQWFRAEYANGSWGNWGLADIPSEYEVGEFHIHGDELYYDSPRAGGAGGHDIWMLTRVGGQWTNPVNVTAVNTVATESRPYVTPDGNELWLTLGYQGTPAVVRSRRVAGQWQEPEMIVSQFAGEPTLDAAGNLYFVHHFYEDGVMKDADIYVAHRK
jgi:hypothetical protein